MDNLGKTLVHHWQTQGVEFNSGANPSAIATFEAKYSLHLPASLRSYFLAANGMPMGMGDDDLIRFWPLDELRPLTLEAPDYGCSEYISDPSTIFVFADWMIWSHAYAVRLGTADDQELPVYIIGGDSPIPIANGFGDFVAKYLDDADRVFPPSQ